MPKQEGTESSLSMFLLPIWFSASLLTLIMQNEQGPRFNLGTSVFRAGEELTLTI